MDAHKESAEQQELLEAMDVVIGATPIRPPAPYHAAPESEDIQPIINRIEEREEQRKRAAKSGI